MWIFICITHNYYFLFGYKIEQSSKISNKYHFQIQKITQGY
nr:MAG TPA: hypothetical protein [Ackermannviridae sp.]